MEEWYTNSLYRHQSDEWLLEKAKREATAYALGAVWGSSPTSDLLSELVRRWLKEKEKSE